MRNDATSCGGKIAAPLLALCLLLCAGPTSAQTTMDNDDKCPAANCGGETTPNQDVRYRDLQIQGVMGVIDNSQAPPTDNASGLPKVDAGLQGSMPGKGGNATPMYTKNTNALPLVTNFPWLYKEVDLGAQWSIYHGVGNNGQKDVNDQTNVTDLTSCPPGTAGTAACANAEVTASDDMNQGTSVQANVASIDTSDLNNTKCKLLHLPAACSANPDYNVWERWVRLQYDSCANQYILPEGLNPAFIFSPEFKSHMWQGVNESICQPLKLSVVPCTAQQVGGGCKTDAQESDGKMYDYQAWHYLQQAWLWVLDSNYTLNGGGNAAMPASAGAENNVLSTNVAGFSGDGTGDIGNPPVTVGGANAITGPGLTGQDQYAQKHITINQLAQHPYERIWDPTHPFSPRWDFKATDRSYSVQARLNGIPEHGYDPNQTSPCIVRCAAVPVDIMSFRATAFNTCMTCRINMNTNCFWSEVHYLLLPLPQFDCPADANALEDTINDVLGCHPDLPTVGQPYNDPISTCKTDFSRQNAWPVCSTKFDIPKDGNGNGCSQCTTESGDPNAGGVTKCCNDLAQALVPLNTLKIRNVACDPTLLDPPGQPSGGCNAPTSAGVVPEGYSFKSYFGDHMPYMRWWDTGTAAGGSTGTSNYNPACDLGQYDVIVGAGREGGGSTDTTKNASYCRYGGGGGFNYPDSRDPANTAGNGGNQATCVTIPLPDGESSWEELKQYQATALRNYGLNCLPQYEKIYKQFGTEDGALNKFGKYNVPWQEPNVQTMGTQPTGGGAATNSSYQLASRDWPLGWRGYLSDFVTANQFPAFNGAAGGQTGLDNAQPGDIVYLTQQDINAAGKSSSNANQNVIQIMPFLGVVTGVSGNYTIQGKPASLCQHYVTVAQVNNGKYPDACGNTNSLDLGQTVTIYRDYLPPNVHEALNPTGTVETDGCGDSYTVVNGLGEPLFNDSGNCMDPKLYVCTLGCLSTAGGQCPTDQVVWNKVHIYRPSSDVRQ